MAVAVVHRFKVVKINESNRERVSISIRPVYFPIGQFHEISSVRNTRQGICPRQLSVSLQRVPQGGENGGQDEERSQSYTRVPVRNGRIGITGSRRKISDQPSHGAGKGYGHSNPS